MKSIPDALLIFPPPYTPTELQPGISAIKGYCEKKGKKIEVIDANIGGLEYVLRKINPKIDKYVRVFKDHSSYLPENFKIFEEAKGEIEKTASHIKQEPLGLRRNTVAYIPRYEAQSRQGILEAIEHCSDNIFNEYFDQELIPKIKYFRDLGTGFAGIGITDRKQSIPGFIIADKIKKQFPGMKVIVGGNFISRSRDIFTKDDEMNRKIFEHLDYLIYLEGDEPFFRLISDDPPDTIEKIIWKDEKVMSNGVKTITKPESFPIPDPSGLRSFERRKTKRCFN